MSHTSDVCVLRMVTFCDLNLTWSWPWPELSIKHSINPFPCGLGVFGENLGQKRQFLRSLRPVTWKPPISNFDLTLTRHVTSFWKFKGALRPSHRDLSTVASLVSLRSAVLELDRGRLTPPPPFPTNRRWLNTPANAGLKLLICEHVLVERRPKICRGTMSDWGTSWMLSGAKQRIRRRSRRSPLLLIR